MPPLLPDPELLAAYQARTGSRLGFEYAVKGGVAPYAKDVVAREGQVKTNDKEMSIFFPFASSQDRDRVGDYLETRGIETGNHERNPLAFLDHGKNFKWPVGLDQDRQKAYTVVPDDGTGLATAKCFVTPILPEHEQIYEFYKRGVLRSGSIGYRTIEEEPLPPDGDRGLPRGKHLLRVELLETSLVFLPCSQDAVLRMYDERWAGKSLADAFRAQLEPHRPRKKPWAVPGAEFDADGNRVLLTVEVREKAVKAKGTKVIASPSPAMSTTDATAGGALVPPPKGARKKDVFPKEDGPEGDPEVPTNYEDAVADKYDETDAEQNASVDTPISHNVQRVRDVHYMLQAKRELGDAIIGKIEEDPHLLDHPDVKELLHGHVKPEVEKISGKVAKLQDHIAAKFAKSHPDEELPDYGGSEMAGTDDDVDDEEGGAKDAQTDDKLNAEEEDVLDPKTTSGTEQHEDKPHNLPDEGDETRGDREDEGKDKTRKEKVDGKRAVNWHAPVLQPRNKGGVARGQKRLNISQKAVIEEVREHLKESAEHPDTPKMMKSAHMYYHAKLGDLFGDNEASNEDPAMSQDAAMSKSAPVDEAKVRKVFAQFKQFRAQSLAELRQMLDATHAG